MLAQAKHDNCSFFCTEHRYTTEELSRLNLFLMVTSQIQNQFMCCCHNCFPNLGQCCVGLTTNFVPKRWPTPSISANTVKLQTSEIHIIPNDYGMCYSDHLAVVNANFLKRYLLAAVSTVLLTLFDC